MELIRGVTMGVIKGIQIILYTQTEAGTDAFNRPIYTETPVTVNNVLVGRPSEDEVLDTLNLTGRKVEYILGIPKGDTHDWEDKTIEFWGQKFRKIGMPVTGIQELIPMDWGQNVRVERYE